MMNETLNFIRNNLSDWQAKNLNEAQTSQAIILRILQMLGYEIWNPFEVFPQDTNTKGAGRPDYLIYLEYKEKFIIEIKALNKDFTESEYTQAVNYVNAKGLRWAISTNGIQWLFFDNSIKGTIDKKLALKLEIYDPFFEQYLEMLLKRSLWLSKHVNDEISHQISLIHLIKIIQEKQDDGYEKSDRGLRLLIKYEISEELKQIADKNFEFLLSFYLKATTIQLEKTILPKQIQPQSNIAVDLFIEVISDLKTEESKTRQVKIKVNNQEIAFLSWRDIHFAIAECFIKLNKTNELGNIAKIVEENQRKLDTYPEAAYGKLSNNQYIYVHYSAKDHKERIKKLLEILGFNIDIFYNNDHVSLP